MMIMSLKILAPFLLRILEPGWHLSVLGTESIGMRLHRYRALCFGHHPSKPGSLLCLPFSCCHRAWIKSKTPLVSEPQELSWYMMVHLVDICQVIRWSGWSTLLSWCQWAQYFHEALQLYSMEKKGYAIIQVLLSGHLLVSFSLLCF
jgi:hypothetical protein